MCSFGETLAATDLLPASHCLSFSQCDDMASACWAAGLPGLRCLENFLSGNMTCSFSVLSQKVGLRFRLNGHYDSVQWESLPFVAQIHYYCRCRQLRSRMQHSPVLTGISRTALHQILTRAFTFFTESTISCIWSHQRKSKYQKITPGQCH